MTTTRSRRRIVVTIVAIAEHGDADAYGTATEARHHQIAATGDSEDQGAIAVLGGGDATSAKSTAVGHWSDEAYCGQAILHTILGRAAELEAIETYGRIVAKPSGR